MDVGAFRQTELEERDGRASTLGPVKSKDALLFGPEQTPDIRYFQDKVS